MKALILVDLQNDFLPGGSLAVVGGDSILSVVNKLLEMPFDLVVATKDWHPIDHGSFAKTHKKNVGETIELSGLKQILWPVHCVQHTQGAEFSSQWHYHKVNKIFFKGTEKEIDSYSAFFDNGHKKSTGLYEYLQGKGVDELYIAGLTTDYCIKYTVLDALKLGFKIYVIVDACKAVNLRPQDEEASLLQMLQEGANLMHSKDIQREFN